MALDRETEESFAGSSSQRLYALGQKLLDQMVQDKAHGPASAVWKTMQTLKGLDRPQQVEVQVMAAPSADVVRQRIAALLQSKTVQQNAEAVGLDLEKLESDPASAVSPDSSAWHLSQHARAQVPEGEPSGDQRPESEPSEDSKPSGERVNWLAEHLAKERELGPS
jgi:hypothetical protein